MDWPTYTALCDTGNVLSRWMISRTALLLNASGEAELARQLLQISRGTPLMKPDDHVGGSETDFFVLTLTPQAVARIIACIEKAARDPSVKLPDGRALAGIPVAWQEYQSWLDNQSG